MTQHTNTNHSFQAPFAREDASCPLRLHGSTVACSSPQVAVNQARRRMLLPALVSLSPGPSATVDVSLRLPWSCRGRSGAEFPSCVRFYGSCNADLESQRGPGNPGSRSGAVLQPPPPGGGSCNNPIFLLFYFIHLSFQPTCFFIFPP